LNLRTLVLVLAITLAYSSSLSGAQRTEAKCRLNLESAPLDVSLADLGRQCDVQILYFSDITAGKTSPKLEGEYAIQEALHLLLDGAGLTFQRVNTKAIEITRAAPPIARRERNRERAEPEAGSGLQEVVIRGTAEGLVATRIETPLQQIPQTLSVISAEQMRQQNSFDLGDALDDAVGITTLRRNSVFLSAYSRGFEVTNYTLDGGGPLRPFSQLSSGTVLLTPDLAGIDHVEVLRGANALFGADGLPGGAINLVRKRPLHDAAVALSSTAGSWNNYRQEVDVTGPLARDGALRGRLDVSFARNDYFYDYADNQRSTAYGVLDYDVTEGTLLTVGGSYSKGRAHPFEAGLPLLGSGADPGLPRSTSYTFDWTRFDTGMREAFLRLDQALGADSRLKLNATWLDSRLDFTLGNFIRAIDTSTGGIPRQPMGRYTLEPAGQKQLNVESTLTGSGEWRGRHLEWAFGGDFLHADSQSFTRQIAFGTPLADAYRFDPANYPDPIPAQTTALSRREEKQEILLGLFTSLRADLTERWSLTGGARVSNERVDSNIIQYFPGFTSPRTVEYEYKFHVTPYLGTLFNLNETWSVYASYADIFLTNGGFVRSDQSQLSPSRGINIEAGIKGAWRDGTLNGSAALYKIVDRGVALVDPSAVSAGQCCYTSAGRNTSKGADLQLTGHLTPKWLIGAGYTFNESRQITPGQILVSPLDRNPRHLLKLWMDYRLPGLWYRWNIGGTVHAQSSVSVDYSACAVVNARGNCLSGFQDFKTAQYSYAVVSPRVGYDIDNHWKIGVNLNNAFDHRYYQTIGSINGGNWYGEPRNFLIRMDAKF
jgi:outer-membrane receptor for ferric coprogen and ferric-rhodotorulic acid